jgi:enoyl-CoA hydratase
VSAPLIHLSSQDGVTILRIDRPPANALDPTLLNAGVEVVEELMAAPPDALVITGTGRFFSSGADLRVVPDLSADEQANLARSISFLFASMYRFPRPMVTAVNGHAVAGGLVIALCGDYRVVGTSGQFGLTEVKVGIPFPSAAMAVVQRELTPPIVRRLVFGTELFDAHTAVRYDIFDEVVADDAVLDRAIEKAREFAALPQATYAAVKARLRADAFDRRGLFGGADAASEAVAESATAARKVLDARSE